MKNIRLLNGKSIRAPAIFLNPTKNIDGKTIHYAIQNYPRNEHGYGLEQIDGIVMFLRDYADVSNSLFAPFNTPLDQFDKDNWTYIREIRPVSQRVKMIDTTLEFLIRGNQEDREKMRKTNLFDKLPKELTEISNSNSTPSEKSRQVKDNIYPKIHAGILIDIIKFQLDKNVDILIAPSVPLSSSRYIGAQLNKSRRMFEETQHLIDTTFNSVKGKIDIMNLISIDAPLISDHGNFKPIIDTLLEGAPNHVGIKLTNLDRTNENQIQSSLNLVKELSEYMIEENGKLLPIHIMNMDQIGYACFCYGASTLTMPIATDPYFYGLRLKRDRSPAKKGTYYYPSKMRSLTYDNLLNETRDKNYLLPCHCSVCEQYENILSVPTNFWNEFRRIHDILYKNIENKMLREVKIPFHQALKDMYARSRVEWVKYIPQSPVISF